MSSLAERFAALIEDHAVIATADGPADAEMPGTAAALYTHATAAPDGRGVTLSARKVCVGIGNAALLASLLVEVAEEYARSISGPFDG